MKNLFHLGSKNFAWYYPAIMLILIFVGIFSSFYVYIKISSFEKQSLLNRSATLSKSLNTDWIASLSGDESDILNPDYAIIKEKIVAVKRINPDARFVYISGRKDGQVYFMVDSEDPGSDSYSPPGQIYPEATQDFYSMFDTGSPLIEGPVSDRWGSWISALSPIVNPETQKIIAVVGMDIEALNYTKTVWLYSSLPLLVTLILLAMIATGWIIRKKEEKILELKSEFVSIASHDIRSPLNGILWSLENLISKSSISLEKDKLDSLRLIEESCRNLLRIINDFLLIPPLEAGGIKKLAVRDADIVELIKKAADDLNLMASKKSIKIIIKESMPPKIMLQCDPEKLKRVFSNIIDNAIKYSQPGSQIEIDRKMEKKFNIFSFKDQGIGISNKDRLKIFQGFFRTDSAKKFAVSGTGLGLYYVKKVVSLQGGKIWFESEENKGTTFYIALK
ncbi:MAG: ATP-binding protein [Patescibacteria group bacterium]